MKFKVGQVIEHLATRELAVIVSIGNSIQNSIGQEYREVYKISYGIDKFKEIDIDYADICFQLNNTQHYEN